MLFYSVLNKNKSYFFFKYSTNLATALAILFCSLYKRFYVFWETATTISTTRIKEFAANTAITTYTLTNHIHPLLFFHIFQSDVYRQMLQIRSMES